LDKKLVIGIIFVSIIVFGAVLLVFRGAIGALYPSGKTIALTYEGDESVHNVKVSVGNGKALVVLFGTNATVSGEVKNGDLSVILNRGNYSISLSVVNGAIHLDAYVTELIGSVQVINGDITFIINTNGGGKISYQISNGNSNIFAEGFQTSISETDSGETGNITSPGSNIDLSVTITNGSFTLVITKLSG